MPKLTELKVPPLADDVQFEELCRDLWARIWGDPTTLRNGRSGQAQKGVDVYGRPDQGNRFAGVQAKAVAKPLSKTEILHEVAQARKFEPPLLKLIIATTAEKDATAEQTARTVSVEHLKDKIFPVTVMGWTDILSLMEDHPDLIEKYLHIHTSSTAITEAMNQQHAETLQAIYQLPDQMLGRLSRDMPPLRSASLGILTPDQRVRVFIGSVTGDLSQEFESAQAAIRDLKLTPVSAQDRSQGHAERPVYRAYLEQSQIYIGIVWESHEQAIPSLEISRVEDEYSLSAGKPRLIYVKEASQGRDGKLDGFISRIEASENMRCRRFSTTSELTDLIKDDIQHILSERFFLAPEGLRPYHVPLSYLSVLQAQMDERSLIERPALVEAVLNQLRSDRKVAVVGDPGAGKTYLLGQVGLAESAVYISLTNKTTQQVFENLANHLLVRHGKLPQSLPSEEEARSSLQEELSVGEATFLIDHVDQNVAVAQAILGLEFQQYGVIFATRSSETGILPNVALFKVPAFTKAEMLSYLRHTQSQLTGEDEQRLYAASQGNPLYLYYFTQYQMDPLPEGLQAYQQALWGQRTPQQQEHMVRIALSYVRLRVNDLHALLNHNVPIPSSIMETKRELDRAAPLIRLVEGKYEFFHPYFEEYVREATQQGGLAEHFHQTLGAYAASKGWAVAAAFHFLRSADARVYEHLLNAIPLVAIEGEMALAEEFSLCQIAHAKAGHNLHQEATARYYLAQVYQHTARHGEAAIEIDSAIGLFDDIGEIEWKRAAELWRATLRAEEGEAEEAIATLKDALEHFQGTAQAEAFCHANLSFCYLRASRFREGAEAAERALAIFTNIGDQTGILTSLGNLSGCLGEMEDYGRLEPYVDQLLHEASTNDLPRHEALGLNMLARIQRHNDDSVAAQETLERAVALCHKISYIAGEAINTANLGNAFLDQKRYADAEGSYLKALAIAREHRLPQQEAHALEMLARLNAQQNKHEAAIPLAEQALELNRRYKEPLRIGTSGRILAGALDKSGRRREAAEVWDESARGYGHAELWDMASYCAEQAAGDWNLIKDATQAMASVMFGVQCATQAANPDRLSDLLVEAPPGAGSEALGQIYVSNLHLFLGREHVPVLVPFMINFSAYCKQIGKSEEESHFRNAVLYLADEACKNPQRATLNALAVAVEQSGDILDTAAVEQLAVRLAEALDHFHYRSGLDEASVWTIGMAWEKPIVLQVSTLDDGLLSLKVSLALALLLYANQTLLESTMTELGGNKEDGFVLHVTTEAEFKTNVGVSVEHSDEEDVKATTTETNVPWGEQQPPSVLILHEGYAERSNWAANPGNSAFVWVLMNVHGALVSQCAHKSRHSKGAANFAKKASAFCRAVLM